MPGSPEPARLAWIIDKAWMTKAWRPMAAVLRLAALHPRNSIVTAEFVKAVRKSGREVNVWTVNSAARVKKLAKWGVTGIITDVAQDFVAGA